MRALAPLPLILICWGVTLAIATLALSNPTLFDLVPVFMVREGINPSAFTGLAAFWLLVALTAWGLGNLAAHIALPRHSPALELPDLAKAARLTFLANSVLLAVTLLWVGLTAAKLGGLANLILLVTTETLTARDILLDNKIFTGMRLFYAALPATGCLAAAILSAGAGALTRRARHACIAVLVLNTFTLALLPIVMSQRLLLLQFLLSAYLVTCLIRRQLFGLPWLVLGTALFLGVWSLREDLINMSVTTQAVPIGLQKLAFYTVNDLWNAAAPLSAETPLAWGTVSFRGLFVLTFTDHLTNSIAPALEAIRGGGEFPLFTAPYVDFGPFGGAALLTLAGFGLRVLFHKAASGLGWAVVYSQCGAALLFSSHGVYLTHQNLLASLIVVALILRRTHPAESPQKANVIPFFHSKKEKLDAAA